MIFVPLSICGFGLAVAAVLHTRYLFSFARLQTKRDAAFLHRLLKECIASQAVEPFAGSMADEITNYLTKD